MAFRARNVLESDQTTGDIFTLPWGGPWGFSMFGTLTTTRDWRIEMCSFEDDVRVAGNWETVGPELDSRFEWTRLPSGVWLRIRATGAGNSDGLTVLLDAMELNVPASAFYAPARPSAPVNLRTTALADTTATVAWDAGPDVFGGHEITKWERRTRVGTGNFGGWADVAGDAAARSVDLTGLTPNRDYTIEIRAVTNRWDGPAASLAFSTPA